ncbi:uncharacterized protein FPRO_10521 [Fusarium proliferatum ET1]|uniref:Uncharacterized protein n=1 Tax=Fusarium proliferatum (strain ET1) TaxID=1227346 RepID=A0A1L7VKT1_FUSPR|nr:uncharacterized protein FPRO_10521 [Fusarium proliferatum ET1]CZR40932.1 uncharacterized protein FPRO_10521 [Fusarium proliferatum ET1]
MRDPRNNLDSFQIVQSTCLLVYGLLVPSQPAFHHALHSIYTPDLDRLDTPSRFLSAYDLTASILMHRPKKLPSPKIQRRWSDDNLVPVRHYSSDMPKRKLSLRL